MSRTTDFSVAADLLLEADPGFEEAAELLRRAGSLVELGNSGGPLFVLPDEVAAVVAHGEPGSYDSVVHLRGGRPSFLVFGDPAEVLQRLGLRAQMLSGHHV